MKTKEEIEELAEKKFNGKYSATYFNLDWLGFRHARSDFSDC